MSPDKSRIYHKLLDELNKPEEQRDEELIQAYGKILYNEKKFIEKGKYKNEVITKERYEKEKKNSFLDKEICQMFAITSTQLYLRKKEWGICRKSGVRA